MGLGYGLVATPGGLWTGRTGRVEFIGNFAGKDNECVVLLLLMWLNIGVKKKRIKWVWEVLRTYDVFHQLNLEGQGQSRVHHIYSTRATCKKGRRGREPWFLPRWISKYLMTTKDNVSHADPNIPNRGQRWGPAQ